MRPFRNLILGLLIAFAGATAAHAQEATIGSWQVHLLDGGCTASAEFEDGSTAVLAYVKASPHRLTLVVFDDEEFAEVKDGEPLDAQLMFVNNPEERKLERRWASLPVTGAMMDSGKPAVMVAGPTDGLLQTFAASRYFALVRDGKVWASFQMSRGPEVTQAVRDCMAKL